VLAGGAAAGLSAAGSLAVSAAGVSDSDVAEDRLRLSVTYQPEPLNTTGGA